MIKRHLSYLLLGSFMLSLATSPVLAQDISGSGDGGSSSGDAGGGGTGGGGSDSTGGAGSGDKGGTTGTMTTTPGDATDDARRACPAGQQMDQNSNTCVAR